MTLATAHKNSLKHLTSQQVESYEENGFLRIPQVFSSEEINEMESEFMDLISTWAETSPGWTGEWRKVYMDEETEEKSKLTAMHDLQFYSQAWMKAVTNKILCDSMEDLLGPNVELHHSTMHVKPPSTGHPFPMHQDWAFYGHVDGRYVDTIVHLDDTNEENGCLRFLKGSHKNGVLKHVTTMPNGDPCTPHLPTDKWKLDDTVPVPAKRGDVICFSIHTVHGSRINKTNKLRRLIRVGYRNPENRQKFGQSKGRFGLMVRGFRPRAEGQAPHINETA